ncbi:DUF1016 N-terminal domain-containing protein [Endozoicomonas sp. ALB032]|uniref:DUF1016 N-terminal domain-containing protein n=1 Tax=Endozoicomonas sp. ALB032 TaxID=3403082 RepID=UPI003BB596E7
MSESQHDKLLNNIRKLLTQGRQQVVTVVNAAMVQTYWEIGRLIVEDEQQGETRAAYGKKVLKKLSESLSREFGKGFDLTNLRKMRAFYLCFPKRDALRLELSWTHYRALTRIENDQADKHLIEDDCSKPWDEKNKTIRCYKTTIKTTEKDDWKALLVHKLKLLDEFEAKIRPKWSKA